MLYESIIRKAHGVDRHGLDGKADAVHFRRFARAHTTLHLQCEADRIGKLGVSTKSVDDLKYELRVASLGVCNELDAAMAKVIREHGPKAQALEALRFDGTRGVHHYDEVVARMKTIENILSEIGLQAG